ncbi:MAG: phosphate ABC transporter permease subunit PstC [Candidatus Latescibacteria bacterium 4484_7]|nr:MAG: phosphate ABC transporter permease subunit PstC [Candidatus Latescibacteria bacterium 4484_7]
MLSFNSDRLFKTAMFVSGGIVLAVVIGILASLIVHSSQALRELGLGFLVSSTWNPVVGKFGAVPFVIGTLLTSFTALAVSLPFSLAISLFLGEYFREGRLSKVLNYMTDLLSGIPSVIFGFWGLLFLVPLMRKAELALNVPPYGVGILTASLVLAVMIIPFTSSIGREVIRLVPQDLKEAAYSLGATRFEVVKNVIIPSARSGIAAGILLSLGRALGETMAVTMVIGNSNFIPRSIFAPGNTMASVIANEFTEATENLYLSSIIEIGLLLFVITAVINYLGVIIMKKLSFEK